MNKLKIFPLLACLSLILAGCSTFDNVDSGPTELERLRQSIDELTMENHAQADEIALLKKKLADAMVTKEETISELEQAKLDLEKSLRGELDKYKAKLEMTEKGLVVTFLAEVFFDSGKADVKESAKPTLKKVAEILNAAALENKIVIEGHTDNDPIIYSGWKSNWELASGRALAVLHYFADEGSIASERLAAESFGEFMPLADNSTPEGRQKNRRVEIVIEPLKKKAR